MEIESGTPPVKIKKPRARRKKKAERNPAEGLIAALKFVLPAQKKNGTIQQQFCFIGNGWVVAANDTLTIATRIEEDLSACPQTHAFLEALSNCSEELQITQLSESALSVKSGPFQAQIPCVAASSLILSGPDEPFASCGQKLKDSLCSLNKIAEAAGEPYETVVMLNDYSAVCTNGSVIAEYWHGMAGKFGKMLPKQAIVALLKTDKVLTHYGASDNSFTFHFEDGSFIKTRTINEQFPPYAHFFEKQVNPWPIQEDFFKALKAVEPFAKEGIVYFIEGGISSDLTNESSFYKIEGLPEGFSFLIKHWLSVEHLVKTIHFDPEENKAYFFGDNVRGIVYGMEKQTVNQINDLNFLDGVPSK